MLSYVFWHWKRPEVDAPGYESRLRRFHEALATNPPDGFHRSSCRALSEAPWANGGGDAYEDWYLIDGFADLGALDQAAVTAGRQAAHDDAAAAAAGGTAGIYRLRLGSPHERASRALWFAKPHGWTYAKLFDLVGPAVERHGGALWMRQMTLGPAAEFCLHLSAGSTVPAGLDTREIALRSVWPRTA
jgi:hypothetical protein